MDPWLRYRDAEPIPNPKVASFPYTYLERQPIHAVDMICPRAHGLRLKRHIPLGILTLLRRGVLLRKLQWRSPPVVEGLHAVEAVGGRRGEGVRGRRRDGMGCVQRSDSLVRGHEPRGCVRDHCGCCCRGGDGDGGCGGRDVVLERDVGCDRAMGGRRCSSCFRLRRRKGLRSAGFHRCSGTGANLHGKLIIRREIRVEFGPLLEHLVAHGPRVDIKQPLLERRRDAVLTCGGIAEVAVAELVRP